MVARQLSSLRTRMLLVVLVTLLPAFGLILFLSGKHESTEVRSAEVRAFELSRSISEQQEDLIQETHQVLLALSRLPAVRQRDADRCSALLSDLIDSYPGYTAIWANLPDGTVFCGSAGFNPGSSNASDSYLQRAVRSESFSVGEYRVGPISGRPVLQMGQPVFEDGRMVAIVAAALDLEWMGRSLSRTLLPEGASVTVIDRNGVVLAGYPADGPPPGTSIAGTALTAEMLARGQGVTRARGPDGVDRLYGFSPLGPEAAGVFVQAGIPTSVALANSGEARRIALVGMAVALVFSLSVAWLVSDLLVVRRYRKVVAVTSRIRAGDLSARLHFRLGGGELHELAESVNGMAVELQRRQDELTAERDFASRVLQTMGQGLTVTDAAGHFTFVNTAFARMLGYEPSTLIGLQSRDVIVADDRAAVETAEDGWKDGRAITYNARLRRRDGEAVFVLVAVVPDGSGSGGRIKVITDLTEQRRSESELRANKEYLDRIIDTVADGLLIMDTEDRFTLANRAAAEIFGVPQGWFDARPPIESAPWGRYTLDGRPLEADQLPFAAVRRTGRPVSGMEFLIQQPDGDRIAISTNAAPLHDDDGRLTGVVASLSDVTAIKAAEVALRASEERFRTLVQNSSDLIAILNRSGRIQYISPAVEKVLGYLPDELIGTAVTRLIHEDDLPRAIEMFRHRTATLGVGDAEVYRLRHADGSWRYLQTIATNLLQNASVRGILLNSHDITERTELQSRLERLAHHDTLTGLPNRARFVECAQRLLDGRTVHEGVDAVLFLDLDDFKRVNDSLGHSAGDALLVAAARRLAEMVRPEDLIARFGGDEFVVLLNRLRDPAAAETIAGRILEAMSTPIEIEGLELKPSVSVGIAVERGGITPIEELLREADLALYRAKASGKGRAVMFAPGMRHRAQPRRAARPVLRHGRDT